MSKVSLEQVEEALVDKVEMATQQDVIRELEALIEALKAEKEDTPKPPKKQLVIVGTDPAFDPNQPLFIAEIAEDDDHNDLRRNIEKAVNAFNVKLANNRRKKTKNWLTTLGEAFETLKGKGSSEHDFTIKTKTPAIAIQVPNELSITNPESL